MSLWEILDLRLGWRGMVGGGAVIQGRRGRKGAEKASYIPSLERRRPRSASKATLLLEGRPEPVCYSVKIAAPRTTSIHPSRPTLLDETSENRVPEGWDLKYKPQAQRKISDDKDQKPLWVKRKLRRSLKSGTVITQSLGVRQIEKAMNMSLEESIRYGRWDQERV
ncbi:hypothetical protein B0H19DRAFT_1086098 [Mycena capillaripes]|nr:hypothetical protein B0H19DRAFT_1086098 [Mycena capillaripes]